MVDDLEERLKSHAKAFDGLLSLIPAKFYYGEDTSDQWQRKKQTKQQARQAKKAKLDPDSVKTVKDVRDENERKRKRDIEEVLSDVEGIEKEKPKEGSKPMEKKPKKQKKDLTAQSELEKGTDGISLPAQADGLKAAKKKSKAERKREKRDNTQQSKAAEGGKKGEGLQSNQKDRISTHTDTHPDAKTDEADNGSFMSDNDHTPELVEMNGFDHLSNPSAVSTPAPETPIFDTLALASGISSTSSVVPPATLEKLKKPPTDQVELRARLAARIEALRAARRADGPNGAPARNRQELMDARRLKEEQRRAHKKELRLKAKEQDKRDNDITAISTAASVTSERNVGEEEQENNFSFGRIAFSDGQQLDAGLSTLLNPRKRKGPQDPLTAMKAAENKRARLSGLDEEKRKDIEEKDLWLNARKRAHGEKVKDDPTLLKKTLKRKEQVKKRSEKEWKERIEGVEKGKEIRQKKREENLRKRRDEKGNKGKKPGKPGKKVKRRPGFEGSFSGKIGGKRK